MGKRNRSSKRAAVSFNKGPAPQITPRKRSSRYGVRSSSASSRNSSRVGTTLTQVTPSSWIRDRKSTRLNSSHDQISYAVFCLKKKKKKHINQQDDMIVNKQ